MTRSNALAAAAAAFDDGRFQQLLARRIACPSASQEPASAPALQAYLAELVVPDLAALGFGCQLHPNPVAGAGPLLIARRREPGAAFTVLGYGHGDVVRGQAGHWAQGRNPWALVVDGPRWYGRGSADNKGQHCINQLALAQVIAARGGRLGYNVTLLLEMGEETGSPGLAEFCAAQREALQADVFLASDGPRVAAERPTLFLGSRGVINFELRVHCRAGAHHSGNWGGLLTNPGVRLAHALASLVDARGRITVPGLVPAGLPNAVRDALAGLPVAGAPGDPEVDAGWGEPGLAPIERVIGWNALEVLAFKTGQPDAPVNAIPGHAQAHCQLRFVVGTDPATVVPCVQAHLAAQGFADVQVQASGPAMAATRLDPAHPWVAWAVASLQRSTGVAPAVLPNLGGSLPNEVFAHTLGLPTLWVPHSYPACNQHAPDEHLLGPVARQALQIMAGLYWDLGEPAAATIAAAPPLPRHA